MRHQAQKRFRGIFVGIPENKKGYLVYVPSTRNIMSSYYVVFDELFSSALAYMSRLYSYATSMSLAMTYTPYATSSREKTGDVITLAQFEEGNILTETRNDAESGDESDNESIMMSKQDMENLYYNGYLRWDSITSKRISCVRTQYKKGNIFIQTC